MPTFNEIQQEIAGMLCIPDEELTPEQREAMNVYIDELAKLEADKVGWVRTIPENSGCFGRCLQGRVQTPCSQGEDSGITPCMAQGTLHHRTQGKRPQESIRQRLHNQRSGN